jgi:asparagine synthase (glutamine-hydrolysing)
MADDIIGKEGAETPCLDTFFAWAIDEPGEEDAPYVTKVEEKRGRVGHRVELFGARDALEFEYPTFVASPGFGGRGDLKVLRASIIARHKYRVLLSGVGGDELLGQALDPRVSIADLLRGFRFREFGRQLLAWSLLLRRPGMHLLFEAFLLQMPATFRARIADIAKVEPWVNRTFARRQRLSARQLDAEGSWLWAPGVRDCFQTVMTLGRQLTKMRPSTEETRYPYLDQRLVEFLTSIPLEQLLRPGERRSLMRRALAGLLPPELLARRTKSTGGRAVAVTLEKHWQALESVLADPVLARLGYIDRSHFHATLSDMKNGNLPLYFLRATRALSWELWLRDAIHRGVVSNLPRRTVPSSVAQQIERASSFLSSASGESTPTKKGGERNDLQQA